VNEFLQQFLVESRELIDQASDGLLSLERSPRNAEQLDAVFRAFHTLKGGAGIVEFPAMERVMHATEDVLSDARAGKSLLTPNLVGSCLACLDVVIQWLDRLEQTGELPAVREVEVDQAIARLGTLAPVNSSTAPGSWVTKLVQRFPAVGARAVTAVRFVPDAGGFYQGEDPLERITALPGLLALELEPISPWGPLDTFDPFACNLLFLALTDSAPGKVAEHLQGHTGECEILPVGTSVFPEGDTTLPERVRKIIEAQLALLADSHSQGFDGRVGSAALTAANVLRFCRRSDDAAAIEAVAQVAAVEALKSALMRTLGLNAPALPSMQAADAAPRTLRVDTSRIDALVRLTGELTVAKNSMAHIAHIAQAGNDSVANALKGQQDILDRLVRELQTAVLGMRVLPLRSVLQRFPRLVREMSASLGKPVKLEIHGDETEADKAIVEMLSEPLLHIVRNAIDHGVESSDVRAGGGKPPVAALQIRAARQGDRVHIEVVDDGGGIDVERVREVATARGVATADALKLMSESEIIDLVFAPGFSTARKVTELSGRGVGMDAVRSSVEKVGGRVSIDSRPGHGTTVRLSLPFSVMMTNVMTVEANGQMFGIPLDVVVETVRVGRDAIAGVGAARALVLRDRTVPVFELAGLLGVSCESSAGNEAIIVVTAFAGQLGAIEVDRIGGRMEVMLAPLEGLLAGMPGLAGTTLLGDGRVLLVLDIGDLLQ
jgi:two-component system, chemotaxis family, sensor kinase CheA